MTYFRIKHSPLLLMFAPATDYFFDSMLTEDR